MAGLAMLVPGQPLGPASRYTPGPGTHLYQSQVCASIAGAVHQPSSSSSGGPPRPSLSVVRPSSSSAQAAILPDVGALVLGRVTRITARQATVAILVVGEHVCADDFQGVIRAQDVRATEKDKVKIAASFRPGDIVRAQVISLGDQSSYYLSTATNAFGVVMASSEAGHAMHPVSWREFKDPVTGVLEARKVAKPF